MSNGATYGGISGLYSPGARPFNPYVRQLQPSLQQGIPQGGTGIPMPTGDDMLGPGNTAPKAPPTQYPQSMMGMGGTVPRMPLPQAAAQGSFPSQGVETLMPGGISRHPATRQGGIMTQSHPDFIGRKMSDTSGGVRPGQMPQMNAVAAARAAQQASFNRPQGQ